MIRSNAVSTLQRSLLQFVVLSGLQVIQVFAGEFRSIDVVEGWTIERRLTEDQRPVCRASIEDGGTWFSARIRLDSAGTIRIPAGLKSPEEIDLAPIRNALERCRSSLLYDMF